MMKEFFQKKKKVANFELLRLRHSKFQIPTAWGLIKILKIFKSSIFSKDLNRVLEILYGADGHEPSGEDVSKLSTEIYQNDLLSG